jgi:GDP-fucose transporter C1
MRGGASSQGKRKSMLDYKVSAFSWLFRSRSSPDRRGQKILAVAFFMVTSIMAVVLNKALFSSYKFPCPLLATSIQFGVACVILVGLYLAGLQWPSVQVLKSLSFDVKVATSVLPVSLTFLGMVCLSNWFLMSVGVGFYAIGKSLAIPFSVVLSYVLLRAPSAPTTVLACFVISAGVFLSSYFDTELNLSGLLLGALSSLFTAGYQIAVKRGLQELEGDQWKLSLYNSIWVVVLLTPIAIFSGEGVVAARALNLGANFAELNWMLIGALVFSGIVGFLIGQATYMSIHYTSALAHHVSGAVKSVLQTAIGIALWGEPATVTGVSGLGLTLFGSYIFMRSRMEPPKPAPVMEAKV